MVQTQTQAQTGSKRLSSVTLKTMACTVRLAARGNEGVRDVIKRFNRETDGYPSVVLDVKFED